jgi:hypothetical protein
MVITTRGTFVRRGAPDVSRGEIDPECAITARLERLAVALATVANWFAPIPLPSLPPRRTRIGLVWNTTAEASAGRLLRADRFASPA